MCLFRLKERLHNFHGGLITHYPLLKVLLITQLRLVFLDASCFASLWRRFREQIWHRLCCAFTQERRWDTFELKGKSICSFCFFRFRVFQTLFRLSSF